MLTHRGLVVTTFRVQPVGSILGLLDPWRWMTDCCTASLPNYQSTLFWTVRSLKIDTIDRPETSVTNNLRYVTSQKSDELIYVWRGEPQITPVQNISSASFSYHTLQDLPLDGILSEMILFRTVMSTYSALLLFFHLLVCPRQVLCLLIFLNILSSFYKKSN